MNLSYQFHVVRSGSKTGFVSRTYILSLAIPNGINSRSPRTGDSRGRNVGRRKTGETDVGRFQGKGLESAGK
jgi:hypothetical protein